MTITSPVFDHGAIIPTRCTRYDANRSPALDFLDVPLPARSLVLIMEHAEPSGVRFTHWVVFNIDPSTSGFRENQIPARTWIGRNSFDRAEYAGPRPSSGENRYWYRLYALDSRLDLHGRVGRAEIEQAMEHRVIARAELMGRYAMPILVH